MAEPPATDITWCPLCGYSLEGLRTRECPECGGDFRTSWKELAGTQPDLPGRRAADIACRPGCWIVLILLLPAIGFYLFRSLF